MPKTLADLIRWARDEITQNPEIANYQLFIEAEEAVEFHVDRLERAVIILADPPLPDFDGDDDDA